MEKHDHPLAWQRLGDLEAGLGSAATLSFADAEAIRTLRGVQYVAGGVHENARVHLGDKRWFTRMHGTDVELLVIKRTWTLLGGRFFTSREQDNAAQVMVLGQVVAEKLFGAGRQARRPGSDAVEPAVRGGRRGDELHLGGAARRPATTSSTRSTCRTPPRTGC